MEINLEEHRGPLKEWLALEPVRREVGHRFAHFLRTFQDEAGEAVYRQRIREMARSEWG